MSKRFNRDAAMASQALADIRGYRAGAETDATFARDPAWLARIGFRGGWLEAS